MNYSFEKTVYTKCLQNVVYFFLKFYFSIYLYFIFLLSEVCTKVMNFNIYILVVCINYYYYKWLGQDPQLLVSERCTKIKYN